MGVKGPFTMPHGKFQLYMEVKHPAGSILLQELPKICLLAETEMREAAWNHDFRRLESLVM